MKFFIKDFFSKCDQIRSFPRIWSYLLKKSLMENFIFYAVFQVSSISQVLDREGGNSVTTLPHPPSQK